MEKSPDDVLLLLLQNLEVPDVLNCRLVSKRLAGLALHRDVWRHRTISYEDPWLCTVLRLAPCLRSLDLWFPWDRCEAPYMTSCATTRLHLTGNEATDAHAALIIRNQQALGELKCIDIDLLYGSSPRVSRSMFLGTLAAVSGLEKIKVDFPSTAAGSPLVIHSKLPTASLKKFTCTGSPELQSFCTAMLSAHSATLQKVRVYYYHSASALPEPQAALLLASMPNLKKVSCNLLPGLDALLASSSLKDFTLHVRQHSSQTDILAAAKFLRGATKLQRLALNMQRQQAIGVTLLLALGSSAKFSIEYLSIDMWDADSAPFLQSLVGALPALPALRHLRLDVIPSYQVLRGITPATSPALRILELDGWGDEGECVLAYADSDEVKSFLSLNPIMHLKLSKSDESCENEDCQTCYREVDYYGVFTHEENGECLLEHTADTAWIHIPL